MHPAIYITLGVLATLLVVVVLGIILLQRGVGLIYVSRAVAWVGRTSWGARFLFRIMRYNARKSGVERDAKGMPKADIELLLEQSDGDEAARARALLSALPEQKRRETLRVLENQLASGMLTSAGLDKNAAAGEEGEEGEIDVSSLGRSDRRRLERIQRQAQTRQKSKPPGRSKRRKR